jgi:hypothetical protein
LLLGSFLLGPLAHGPFLLGVNPADPGDFVTDFGKLSGHRGRVQAALGALGFGVLVLTVPALLSRIPLRRWLGRDALPGRPAAEVRSGTTPASRFKFKRNSRR